MNGIPSETSSEETAAQEVSTILVVDDQPIGRRVLEELLFSPENELYFSSNGPDALQMASQLSPDLILLDVMMPGMDGFEVCRRLRTDPRLAEVPILMLTSLDDASARLEGLEAGADDFILKPYSRAELRARVRTITRLGRYRKLVEGRASLERAHARLLEAYDATIEGWSRAMDLRDKETEGHTQRVTKLTLELARQSAFSETELRHIRWGALLHDIGKMGVPDHILLKPGQLSDDEWVLMKQHPVFAHEMLSPVEYLRSSLDIPYCHHEKWDGTGYPRGLRGEEIPLAARLFAVVDVWDALTSDRPYRPAWTREKTVAHIREQSGRHFDPGAVDAFLELITAASPDQTRDDA
jgi:cyclic di-GMP phosphodiesterase